LLFNFATLPKCYVVILFQIFTNRFSFTIAINFDQIKKQTIYFEWIDKVWTNKANF